MRTSRGGFTRFARFSLFWFEESRRTDFCMGFSAALTDREEWRSSVRRRRQRSLRGLGAPLPARVGPPGIQELRAGPRGQGMSTRTTGTPSSSLVRSMTTTCGALMARSCSSSQFTSSSRVAPRYVGTSRKLSVSSPRLADVASRMSRWIHPLRVLGPPHVVARTRDESEPRLRSFRHGSEQRDLARRMTASLAPRTAAARSELVRCIVDDHAHERRNSDIRCHIPNDGAEARGGEPREHVEARRVVDGH